MDTSKLIKALASDSRGPAVSLSSVWSWAVGNSIAISAVVFLTVLGPRPDIATAIETPRFLFKFLVTITLAVSAFYCVRALARPGERVRNTILCLAVAPALTVMAVVVELFILPPDIWSATMIGTNSIVCLIYIPLIGLGPLVILLLALCHSAPTRPRLAGAVAGVLAGGIAATFYAAQCNNDSPLFVAAWYTIAIAGLAVLGAIGANQLARW